MERRNALIMPQVSIIIPCYNHASFLKEAVQSCLGQSFEDIEIIVVDDGSTDRSRKIINAIKDPRLSIIFQENKGVGAARNKGIEKAQGAFIQFLDADDFIHPDKIKYQVEILKSKKDVAFALCDVSCMNSHGEPEGTYTLSHVRNFQNLFHALFLGGFFPPNIPLLRKKDIQEAGLFNEERHFSGVADYDLWLRISAKNGKFAYIDQKLAYYRNVSGSMSKHVQVMERGQEECLAKITKAFPETAAQAVIQLRREKENLKAANAWLQDQLRAATVGDKDPLVNELLRNKKAPVYVWGAGNKGQEAIGFLNSININPKGIIDSNKERDGDTIDGLKIVHAQRFAKRVQSAKTKPFVVVASMYSDEIKRTLSSMEVSQYGVFN